MTDRKGLAALWRLSSLIDPSWNFYKPKKKFRQGLRCNLLISKWPFLQWSLESPEKRFPPLQASNLEWRIITGHKRWPFGWTSYLTSNLRPSLTKSEGEKLPWQQRPRRPLMRPCLTTGCSFLDQYISFPLINQKKEWLLIFLKIHSLWNLVGSWCFYALS